MRGKTATRNPLQSKPPSDDGKGRAAAIEILMNTPMIQSLIFKGEVQGLKAMMSKGKEQGMCTFDQALFDLHESGLISLKDALRNADSVSELKLAIKLKGSRKDDSPGADENNKPKLELEMHADEGEDKPTDGVASFANSPVEELVAAASS